jgi:methionyl-tRNA synthetase
MEEEKNYIDYEDFKKVEIRVGEVVEVEEIPASEKLLKLKVSFGHVKSDDPAAREERQILSGIKKYYEDPQSLVGKKIPFVTNLKPRKMMGFDSEGMILAAIDDDNNFSLPEIDSSIKTGTNLS